MKLYVLGTGNASVTECYNTCFLLMDEKRPAGDRCFLVDGGGGNGLLAQMKRAGIDWREVRSIFVSHRHMDHITGILWMMRNILSGMKHGTYDGEASIYGHDEVIHILRESAALLFTEKDCAVIGSRLHLITVEDGESFGIIGKTTTFFDIGSAKTKQFGFRMSLDEPCRALTFCGDEPCHENGTPYAERSEWLLFEAFCLSEDAGRFKPYEKGHSTVKDACGLAEKLAASNLILYHTEDTDLPHRKQRYLEEGRQYYRGNLLVPDDLEIIDL